LQIWFGSIWIQIEKGVKEIKKTEMEKGKGK
jgi:hypothetical protein